MKFLALTLGLSVILVFVAASPRVGAAPANQPNITWALTGTNGSALPIYTGTWAPAAASGTNTVQGFVTYGWLDVVAAGNASNAGTINLNFPGYTADNRDRMTFTLNSGAGTLTNTGILNFNPVGSYGGSLYVYGKVLNDAGGTLNVAATNGSSAVLGTAGATHENRGTWSVTGNYGMTLAGGDPTTGTTFTQSTAGASLAASNWLMQNSSMYSYQSASATVVNSFSATAGSLQGYFTFQKTAVTLGSAVTVSGPTTFQFMGTQSNNVFTGNVPANLTLLASETVGASMGGWVNAAGSFINNGTITLRTNDGAGFNNANGRLTVNSGGTLTNNGTMNLLMTAASVHGDNYVTFDGNLANAASGVVNVTLQNAAANPRTAQFIKTGGVYTNAGLFDLNDRANFAVNGSTFTNQAGGIVRNTGAANSTNATWSGTATFDNAAGTVEVIGGTTTHTFNLTSPLSAATRSGGALLAGAYTVTGGSAATTLSLGAFGGAGTITALGAASGPAATVTFANANSNFTQLESASGSLATINATGRLNVLGGKTFTSAPALASSGRIKVGTTAGDGSTLNVGSSGTGTLTLSSGGWLGGPGTVQGSVALSGGTVSPGASPGTQTINGNMTWGGGSTYAWEVDQVVSGGGDQSALKGIDPGFDFLSISGTLNITATSANPFLLDIAGLAHPSHALGAVTNWNPTFESSWVIASAAGGITGFNDRSFAFSDANFYNNNSIAGHRFWVAQSGTDLLLVYIVPEPATLALLALAGGALISRRRR